MINIQNSIIKPPRLFHGDTLGIISPSGFLSEKKLKDYKNGLNFLKKRGYKLIEGEAVRNQRGYLAGKDVDRVQDINKMFKNPEIKAIFCSRGGYGLTRILDDIDYSAVIKSPKIIVGFSDITCLQLALFKMCNLVTFSGPMIATDIGKDFNKITENNLWNSLSGTSKNVLDPALFQTTPKIYKGGVAEGRLLGGCLSVLVSLLGSPYVPDFTNSILLLEDVGEDLYKIDRYFSQLKNTGILKKINGVILGQFFDIIPDNNNNPVEFDDLILYYFTSLNIPVLGNFPYGHISKKFTMPLGTIVRLDADKGLLFILEHSVKDD